MNLSNCPLVQLAHEPHYSPEKYFLAVNSYDFTSTFGKRKKKLNPLYIKNNWCQVCLKLPQWFWKRRFLKGNHIFSTCCYYLPLKKGMDLHLNKLESHYLRMLCVKFN